MREGKQGPGSLDQALRLHAGRKMAPVLSYGFCTPAISPAH